MPDWDNVDVSTLEMIPMQPTAPLSKDDTRLSLISCAGSAVTDFASQCGALNWLSHTSADFIHATRVLSSKMSKPTELDCKRMRHLISCLARIRRLDLDGLILGGRNGMELLSTVDSSHGTDNLKGRTGGTLHMSPHTGSIMSLCETQSITADSAMACEGIGAHLQIRRILPIIFFCEELGHPIKCVPYYMDNLPFMKTITGSRGCSEKSKHILIRMQLMKEAYDRGEINLLHLNTENMVSDILTKSLPREDWYRLRAVLLGHSPIIMDPSGEVESVVE